jgi:hypothetical protein
MADAADDKLRGAGRVNLSRACELLHQRGDMVAQSTLSRYVAKYADALDPQAEGREVFVDFDALAQHRAQNVNRGYRGRLPAQRSSTPNQFDESISIQRGRADEAALNIRAQRQMRELEIAERIGALTPTREVRDAAAEAMSKMRNAFALSLNDSASALAAAFNLEARLVRPYLKAFERNGLDAFARALVENDLVATIEPNEGGAPLGAQDTRADA